MKRFALPLIAASLGATLATTALASGPTAPVYEPPVMLPSPVAVYDWTGFYGGLNVGRPTNSNTWDGAGATTSTPGDWSGTIWGLTLGYDMQAGDWVYGAALDYSPSNFDATGTSGTLACAAGDCLTELDDTAALRARFGRAFDRTMVYGTAGFATGSATGTYGGTVASDRLNGYTVGLGIEHAITDNVSLNAEYLYTDLGTLTLPLASTDVSYGTVRIGANFRF